MRESCTRYGSEVLGYTRQDPFLYTLQLELTEASDTSIQAERLRIGFRTRLHILRKASESGHVSTCLGLKTQSVACLEVQLPSWMDSSV